MKTEDRLKAAASVLRQARAEARPCCPISQRFGINDLTDAYEIQEINTQYLLDSGARLVGRKIGLTSQVVQQQLGVNEPDFGMLFDSMERLDGAEIESEKLIAPKVEGEIAFVLGRDLTTPKLNVAEFLGAVAYVLPALEIVDSAIEDWNITITDTVADNASAALYVLGRNPVSLDGIALELEGMLLAKNGKTASTGIGAACMGHPLNACMWLAHIMIELGRPLLAGDVLLSGALGPMVPVQAGDSIRMSLARLGQVECHFV